MVDAVKSEYQEMNEHPASSLALKMLGLDMPDSIENLKDTAEAGAILAASGKLIGEGLVDIAEGSKVSASVRIEGGLALGLHGLLKGVANIGEFSLHLATGDDPGDHIDSLPSLVGEATGKQDLFNNLENTAEIIGTGKDIVEFVTQ